MNEAEKREFLSQLVDNVQIYEERKENGQWLKSIEFKLPIIEKEFTLSLDNDTQNETVVLLSWKSVDDFMYVDYAPDYHVIQGGKASYKEITEWIQETYGAHVTNLNIAQVKDKCGFEKRENYNKGTEGHRVPNCTPEKEQMILSAFKHFNML